MPSGLYHFQSFATTHSSKLLLKVGEQSWLKIHKRSCNFWSHDDAAIDDDGLFIASSWDNSSMKMATRVTSIMGVLRDTNNDPAPRYEATRKRRKM